MNDKNELSLHGLHQIKNGEQQGRKRYALFQTINNQHNTQGNAQAQ